MKDLYPRPQMARDSFFLLDGDWELVWVDETGHRTQATVKVPYSPEAEASRFSPEEVISPTLRINTFMRYCREVVFPEDVDFSKERLFLNFGAVDYRAIIYIDSVRVLEHTGGFLPFSVEVNKRSFVLEVSVFDPSDSLPVVRGKQSRNPGGIWYPAQSGIWQSVWMEKTPKDYIKSFDITPDLEGFVISVETSSQTGGTVEIEGKKISFESGKKTRVNIENPLLWSPEHPHLYNFTIRSGEDCVSSYAALRTFGIKDGRLQLNGKNYFNHGLLDQGYWKGGLYTPLSDSQMTEDILLAKRLGFNTLRKHIKVESLRWYYHCDRLGILVWQDMVSGGGKYNKFFHSAPLFTGSFLNDRDPLAQKKMGSDDLEYKKEWLNTALETIRLLKNSPSVVMWVAFNEGWGQFDSSHVCSILEKEDPSRPVDYTSGWHDQGDGPFKSVHCYFRPYRFKKDKAARCVILSEFGGYGLKLEETEKKNFTYRKLSSREELTRAIMELYEKEIIPAKQKGLAASIYTQLSDVEQETNGLVTYDRKTVKVLEEPMRMISEKLCDRV